MEAAASDAARELNSLDPEAVKSVKEWWKKHYPQAGHKRLARALLKSGESSEEADA